MVRTTIACARCRKLKIKCGHDGLAPCRNCLKKGASVSRSCVLSGPELKSRSRFQISTTTGNAVSDPNLGIPSPTPELPTINEHGVLHSVQLSAVLLACSTFVRKFPELRFLHWPSFSKLVRAAWDNENYAGYLRLRLLCASIMAVCGTLPGQGSSPERLASYVRANISIIDTPDVITVQTLIVLSMYEWSIGNGYRGWMYTGTAARMMQSLLVLVKLPSLTPVEREVHNRTLWSCFIMDRLVFCGRTQPFVLSVYSLNTHWPIGEQDFAFGQTSGPIRRTDGEHGPLEFMEGDLDHYYGVLVRGFDIWARILKFVVSGGRRQPGMCLPENHPWAEGSPWRLLHHELQMWRDCQISRLRYPETSVEGHVALGHGEQFGYINLIYYVSLLFLMREYIPFVPSPDSEPSGPVDPPLLPIRAPSGWWHDRAEDLFTASTSISALLEDLRNADAALYTPYAGFCSFSAATMNLYVSYFPNMNLGRSKSMDSIISMNLKFLDDFRKLCPMGEGWWVTIQHCKALYEHASKDRQSLQGRTRADFAALEYSIHDSRGQPPNDQDHLPHNDPETQSNASWNSDNAVDAVNTMIAGEPDVLPVTDETTEISYQQVQDASQIWPLWGEQQSVPFAVEGLPFDFNMDILNT